MCDTKDVKDETRAPGLIHLDMADVAATLRDRKKVKEGSMSALFSGLCKKLQPDNSGKYGA